MVAHCSFLAPPRLTPSPDLPALTPTLAHDPSLLPAQAFTSGQSAFERSHGGSRRQVPVTGHAQRHQYKSAGCTPRIHHRCSLALFTHGQQVTTPQNSRPNERVPGAEARLMEVLLSEWWRFNCPGLTCRSGMSTRAARHPRTWPCPAPASACPSRPSATSMSW